MQSRRKGHSRYSKLAEYTLLSRNVVNAIRGFHSIRFVKEIEGNNEGEANEDFLFNLFISSTFLINQ